MVAPLPTTSTASPWLPGPVSADVTALVMLSTCVCMFVVAVTLTVTLPADFGAISGTVTDAHTGEPLGGVSVVVHASFQGNPLDLTATTAGDGSYSVTGPAGTWPATRMPSAWASLTMAGTQAGFMEL